MVSICDNNDLQHSQTLESWANILQWPIPDVTARNHGSCINHLGLDDIYYNDYNYSDSQQARLLEGIGHCFMAEFVKVRSNFSLYVEQY